MEAQLGNISVPLYLINFLGLFRSAAICVLLRPSSPLFLATHDARTPTYFAWSVKKRGIGQLKRTDLLTLSANGNRVARNEKERNNINWQARLDLLNANALMKKAARNPESIADGGCTYGWTDGRANRRTDGRDGVREPRARDRTGTNETRENPGMINWTSGYDDNRDSLASQL